jgi:predicted enzyme related to lactoylglutathione lyase
MTTTTAAEKATLRAIAPHFAVADVVAAAEYYREKLGFELLSYFLDPPVFAMVARDGIEIHLGKQDEGQTAVPNSAFRRIGLDAYIWTNDIHKLAAELKERGADIVEGPVTRVYGSTEVVIRDCNGYRIAFGD